MKKVLLTGATGFIGQRVLLGLANGGHTVLAPTRNPHLIEEHDSVEVLDGLFYDNNLRSAYSNFKPDVIIHLAALRGQQNSNWEAYYECNVRGTDRLVDFALDVGTKLFIHCSAVGIYGIVPSRLPADPWTSAIPEGKYYRSKYLAEKQVVTRLRHQLPFVVMRPTFVYGPGNDGFLFKLVQMVKKRSFPLANKDVHIHLVDVNTLTGFIVEAVSAKIEEECIVNIADRDPVQLSSLVNIIHEHFHGGDYPRTVPASLHMIGERVGKILHIESLYRRSRMISNSWYYDTTNLEDYFNTPLQPTLNAVKSYLMKEFPAST